MKKNVVALAVAAAMAAPLAAQAEVNVSGGLQAELVSLGGDGAVEGLYAMDASEGATADSGNLGYLAFQASEDLGGGMKALAKYNMKTAVDNVLGTRDAYVGLTGGFGTILAGRMSSPYKSSTVKWDPFLATSGQARGSYGMSTYHNSYVDNAVAYANKFGMVKLVAAIVIDEAADNEDATKTSADHATSLGLNIPVGPVEIAVGYLNMDDFGSNGALETGDKNATKVGVKYNAGAITVAAQHETLNTGDDTDTFTYVTGSFAAGANTFSASYGVNNDESGANEYDNKYMAIGMKHAFSKTTSAHVLYRASDEDSDAGDDDVTAVAAGLRVKF